MAIPTEQLDPFTRKRGGKRKRARKARAQTGKTKPLSTEQPPKKIFGHPKPQPQQQRVLDYEGLRAKGIHYHPNHLRRLWTNGKFPMPFKPTPRKNLWREALIDAWLAEKEKERAS